MATPQAAISTSALSQYVSHELFRYVIMSNVIMMILFMLSSMLWCNMLMFTFIVINIRINLIWKLPNFPTIQKPYYRQFPEITMARFADALKPDKFFGVHFKRWQVKVTLWLTAMNVFWVSNGKSEGELSDSDQKKFAE